MFVNEGNMDLHKNGHPQPFMYMLSNKHRHGVIIFVHSRPAILNQFSICFTFYSKTINKSFRMDMVHNNLHRTRSVFIKSIDGLTSTALALSLSTTSPHYYNFIQIICPNTTLNRWMAFSPSHWAWCLSHKYVSDICIVSSRFNRNNVISISGMFSTSLKMSCNQYKL